ncbi:hypothetical protein [Rhodospirillaceae bacterium SYSU D60014]|uniref:hypothetical protein n=1 Tax=Virgifigura deserti TaxID=2268457 RepID=UPI0013C4ED36
MSPSRTRRIQIGDSWCDVFLWNGEHHVGEPGELWEILADVRGEIAAHAPISLLDLALFAGAGDWQSLARNAFSYIQGRFGDEKARLWRSDTFIRKFVILHLRRLIQAGDLAVPFKMAQAVEIDDRSDGTLSIETPEPLINELVSTGRADQILRELQTVADPFSLTVEMFADTDLPTAPLVTAPSTEGPDDRVDTVGGFNRPDILIVVLGKRAEEIARHLGPPEWVPAWSTGQAPGRYAVKHFPARRYPRTASLGEATIHIVHGGADLPQLNRYGVLIAIVDDEYLVDGSIRKAAVHKLDQLTSEKGVIRLLAPALPRDRPARVMSARNSWIRYGDTGFQALLDTSTARSFFWSGNPRRALDRRIADIIIGAAVLSASPGPLSEYFRSSASDLRVPLLTLSLEVPRQAGGHRFEWNSAVMGMVSEAIWSDHSGWSRGFTPFSARFGARWLTQHAGFAREGVVAVLEAKPDFKRFARSILDGIRESAKGYRANFVQTGPVPQALSQVLEFPEHVCGVGLQRDDRIRNLALIGETPNIRIIKAAADVGWAVVRYTDHETIRELLTAERRGDSVVLPREIQLSNVCRIPHNRRLATRGIDPRDVIRLSEQQVDDLRQKGRDAFVERIRQYRAAIAENEGPAKYVVPRNDIADAAARGSDAAAALLRQLEREHSEQLRSPKRWSDLQTAWSVPPDGSIRFVIADGRVPVVLIRLVPSEVPAQNFFIVDGDAAVPALLQSQVFEVWARVTLSRSTSWMSRFSVSGTFETFPVVPPFELMRQPDGASALMLGYSDKMLYRLARDWLTLLSEDPDFRRSAEYKRRNRLRDHPLRQELDAAILDVYRLPPNASDLEILERLLSTNDSLQTSLPMRENSESAGQGRWS